MKLTHLPLQNDDLVRVQCDGPVSLRRQPRDYEPLASLLGPQCYGHRVLLNLERTLGVDTSGVSWLMRVQGLFARSGGRLVVCAVPPVVQEVLDLLRLTDLLDIANGEAEARAAAAAPAGGPRAPGDGALPQPTRLSG